MCVVVPVTYVVPKDTREVVTVTCVVLSGLTCVVVLVIYVVVSAVCVCVVVPVMYVVLDTRVCVATGV